MSNNNHHKDDPSQDQDQDQLQAQLEAQLQGQLQGQGQGQGQLQGQGQGQGQAQAQAQLAAQGVAQGALQYSENDSKNENDNKNENSNENSLDNKVDNSIDNKVENTVENNVKTDVDVSVKVDLDLSELDLQPAISVEDLDGILFQMPDKVDQAGTNNFNIDQVNNLVDNDKIESASVNFNANGYEGADYCCDTDAAPSVFSMSAKAEGGTAKIDDAKASMEDGTGAEVVADASASLTQDAFTQSIVMGANIQFNSVTINLQNASSGDIDTGSEG